MIEPFANALILTGPTGSGKTRLGIELAKRLGAEIISMDSMALYRGMDIGTAKPTSEERHQVPHHLVDVLDPWESASVAWWLDQAATCCQEIEARGKRVLFVGGTPLYLKAMCFGLFEGPAADPQIRQALEEEGSQHGSAGLHDRLAKVDASTAARLHPNDLRRIVRALEVFQVTGKPISSFQQQWSEEPRSTNQAVWIDLPRAELYARINRRVETMFASGLVDEVRGLRKLPKPLGREAAQALGYKEVLDYLEGKMSLEETMMHLQARTRQFAKRQITWFRHLPGIRPVSGELTGLFTGPTMD